MTIEDSGGSDIVTAAIAHLAHSTPEAFRFNSSDVNDYNTRSIADGGPQQRGGYIKAPTGAGLGVTPYLDVLGKAVLTIA
jgi:L-alanine-DL-glutamate epimerase-like enolase superfamily enzyme